MLKTLIKRSGEEEPLIPSKVNGWGQWASGELQGRVDWSYVVMTACATLPEKASTVQLQERLIKVCREQRTWAYSLMAGKLYSTIINKRLYPEGRPTVQQLHKRLFDLTLMRELDYSDEEYAKAQGMIQHDRDFQATYFELHQVREKYAILNRVTGQEYETMQFVYMRMAMALAEDQPVERRMQDVFHFYDLFSRKVINAPTPNYLNLGTNLRGYASCCLYAADDNVRSLAIGDHIAYTMTYMSCGIGNNINLRSVGDPIRGGAIKHQGKMPYMKSLSGAVKANLQNGRGGACTTYYSAYDPEAIQVLMMKNPRTTENKRLRDIDFAMMVNKFLARKVARNEQMFTFNTFTAPDLLKTFYGDGVEFERLYHQYEADPKFVKNYVFAREVVLQGCNQMNETGRGYQAWMDEANRHTPFKEPILSSNLCTEIFEPTSPYRYITELYEAKDHGYILVENKEDGSANHFAWSDKITIDGTETYAGALKVGDMYQTDSVSGTVSKVITKYTTPEVALCSLGAIVLPNVTDDEEYKKATYYALLMVDKCIHQADYELPQVGWTAKQRMNAGIGQTGLATHLARLNLKYTDTAGKQEMHRQAERHMYYLIEASLQLGKELGNAPWMHKTKWPQGWTPLKTYTKNVDEIADFTYRYDWQELSQRLIANQGIRNSVLSAFMPTESSSKASGAPNSLYPVRFLSMLKTDEHTIIDWCAPDNDIIGNNYQLAWSIPTTDMIDCYAIYQKFTDQGISGDTYRKISPGETIGSKELLDIFLYKTKRGLKSSYYTNTLTSKTAEQFDFVSQSSEKPNQTEQLGNITAISAITPSQPTLSPMSTLNDLTPTSQSPEPDHSLSALDRVALQVNAALQAHKDDEQGDFIGNDGPVCTSGGCSV